MPNPISTDLRIRIVQAYQNGEGTYKELADRFRVGWASVARFVARSLSGLSLEPLPHSGGSARKIDETGEEILKNLVKENPDLTDEEYAKLYSEKTNVSVSHSTINQALHRLRLTRKKSHLSRKSGTRSGSRSFGRTSTRGRSNSGS